MERERIEEIAANRLQIITPLLDPSLDTDYDYYDKTLGFFNHLYGNDRTCTVNVFDSPDFAGEGDPENVVMVLSGNTIVTGTYAFDEQDLLVKDMTPRSYWATFTPDEEFAGVGSFRFTVPFVRK